MTECECVLAGYCARRQVNMPVRHFERCQAGERNILDVFYDVRRGEEERRRIDPPVKKPSVKQGVSAGCGGCVKKDF